ncbi:Hypothetical predicted protein [Mytilus galloprovincialis]|uniref:Uncharacterized protein n=1 Tax=Mytilus galloprovincialis TaxID=29158 RepID=A0A8B6HSS8_MYTGA|nr:Hypothetical predicted protein [Mytilus galloprovincialis]
MDTLIQLSHSFILPIQHRSMDISVFLPTTFHFDDIRTMYDTQSEFTSPLDVSVDDTTDAHSMLSLLLRDIILQTQAAINHFKSRPVTPTQQRIQLPSYRSSTIIRDLKVYYKYLSAVEKSEDGVKINNFFKQVYSDDMREMKQTLLNILVVLSKDSNIGSNLQNQSDQSLPDNLSKYQASVLEILTDLRQYAYSMLK